MKIYLSLRSKIALITTCSTLLLTTGSSGQGLVTSPMTGTPAPGEYYNPTSITLQPNFSFTASPGQSLRIFISGNCVPLASTPSGDQNYTITYLPRTTVSNANILSTLSTCEVSQSIQYLDGFGRMIQSVSPKASPSLKDIIKPFAYDVMGREIRRYLPYATNAGTSGSYRVNAINDINSYIASEQYSFYQQTGSNYATSTNPYNESRFDQTPQGRLVESGFAGTNWAIGSGHTVTFDYVSHGAGQIRKWTLNASGASFSYYDGGVLNGVLSKNENGELVTEYKWNGRLICKKVQQGNSALYTDYVYDDAGNLRYVIPPLPASVALPSSFIESDDVCKNFFFVNHYDGENRLIEKKVPGKGWEYFVYNKLNQVVLSQIPTQLDLGIWMFNKFDKLGRTVLTGSIANGSIRAVLQQAVNDHSGNIAEVFENGATNFGYSDESFPNNSFSQTKRVSTVSYYDDYKFITNNTINPNANAFTEPPAAVDTLDHHPIGTLTGQLSLVIGTSSPIYLLSVNHYNTRGVIAKNINQVFKQHSNQTEYDTYQYEYSFNNLLVKTKRERFLAPSGSSIMTIVTLNDYDHIGKKTLIKQQYITPGSPGSMIALAKYDYNDLGQLITKHLHNPGGTSSSASNFFQHIDFRYNIRGWLSRINNPDNTNMQDENFQSAMDVYAESLAYDYPNTTYGGVSPQYNGNISFMTWNLLNKPGYGMVQGKQNLAFQYDGLSRLISSEYKSIPNSDNLNETFAYDELGNILTLDRKSPAQTYINKLQYDYGSGNQRSNRLLAVTDQGTNNYTSTYSYNTNGNEINNSKQGVSNITYNELNLPDLITFSSGKTIQFFYNSLGEKLERTIYDGPVLEDRSYVNGVEYVDNTIDFIQTDEGRVVPSGNTFTHEYKITDHLGNVRAIISGTGTNFTTNNIVQAIDYYASGKEIVYFTNTPDNKYKFSNKEMLDDLGAYDYGPRYYNPTTARWSAIDRAADQFTSYSPYNYALNNPIRNIDPDGDFSYDQNTAMANATSAELARVSRPDFGPQRDAWQDADYEAGRTSMPSWNTVSSKMYAGLSHWLAVNDPYRGFGSSASDGGGLYGALNYSGSSGNGGGLRNFLVHLTPFGGIVDFANSARTGNYGGAILGLASTASFFTGFKASTMEAADLARSYQRSSAYSGIDSWRNISLQEGRFVAGGLPGQSPFYTTMGGLSRSELSQNALWSGLQVQASIEHGLRGYVGIYRVPSNMSAAFGTTYANPAYGAGGLPQLYIPNFNDLKLLHTIPLK